MTAPNAPSVERLEQLVAMLATAYDTARAGIQSSIDRGLFGPDTTPEQVRDPNGRFILLDALVALATTAAAAATLRGVSP